MFRNYPINLNLGVKNAEELRMRIKSLREVFDSGINESVFNSIVSNIHNNQQQSPTSWNKKTLEGWVDFLNPYVQNVQLGTVQLDKIFKYLTTYHSRIIRKDGNEFGMMLQYLKYDDSFLFEYIALIAMEEN